MAPVSTAVTPTNMKALQVGATLLTAYLLIDSTGNGLQQIHSFAELPTALEQSATVDLPREEGFDRLLVFEIVGNVVGAMHWALEMDSQGSKLTIDEAILQMPMNFRGSVDIQRPDVRINEAFLIPQVENKKANRDLRADFPCTSGFLVISLEALLRHWRLAEVGHLTLEDLKAVYANMKKSQFVQFSTVDFFILNNLTDKSFEIHGSTCEECLNDIWTHTEVEL